MTIRDALHQVLGSASRADCDNYATLLDQHLNSDDGETPTQRSARSAAAARLPETVRGMVEDGRY